MNPTVKPYVLILAGGVGSRFWPASRENRPKQFLDITGTGNSLLRETVNRFTQFVALDRIYIITHKNYSTQIREAIPELMESQIILEPSRNNTAASIAYASLKLHKMDPEAICIVAPADHIIRKEAELQRVLQMATDHAVRHQSLITLGI
ncbi:MAG TPA: sugar phosphate nucleotidyltransferase, partial [Saprospiraceae bacterium]|nr:sugar phosphate nucleotidyltransferase [Saprospiraceae bacterium]